MQNRLILTSVWQLSTGREISLWRSTLRSEGPEPHTGDPQARVLVLGRGAPTKFGVKISRDSDHLGEMEDCWKPRHPLKGRMHRITRRHSPCGFRERAGETAIFILVLSPPPTQPKLNPRPRELYSLHPADSLRP